MPEPAEKRPRQEEPPLPTNDTTKIAIEENQTTPATKEDKNQMLRIAWGMSNKELALAVHEMMVELYRRPGTLLGDKNEGEPPSQWWQYADTSMPLELADAIRNDKNGVAEFRAKHGTPKNEETISE